MAAQLDLCDIRDMAQRLGVKRADGNELSYVPSSVLGTNELSALSLAGAMAGFANQGVYCSPIAIDRVVVRGTSQEMRVPLSQCSQAMSPEVAAAATYAFEQVIRGGTGTRSQIDDDVPIAGKTGTSDSSVQTWMTGFSTEVATAAWVGNVSGSVKVDNTSVRGLFGGAVRHEIWRKVMTRANALYGGQAFPKPPDLYLGASKVVMPDVNALLPVDAEEFVKIAGLSVKIAKTQVLSLNPIGTIAYADYEAGTEVIRGSLVTLYISKGGEVVVPDVSGLTVAEAKAKLLAEGFSAVSEPVASQSQFFVTSATIPAGNVVSTSPGPGTPAEGLGAILLIISKGPN
jgi:membrane peptidoglycan carboxypeptidase